MSDDRCDLCEPAPHTNCEAYTMLVVEDPKDGSDATVDVCLEHYEALEEVMA